MTDETETVPAGTLGAVAEFLRATVRPVLTLGICAGFLWAALSGDQQAARLLIGPATAIAGWWFKDRREEKAERNGR